MFTGSEEYLYVARTEILDVETRSRDLDEQLNRVFVARQIELALKTENREKSVQLLKEAYDKIQKSDSKSIYFIKQYINTIFLHLL
jgi:hypothetical protein